MITSGQTSIGTAATIIDTTGQMPFRLHVHNDDNTDALYLGGAGVTTTTGMQLLKQESVVFDMYAGEVLYAVSTKAGHTMSWLKQQQ